MESIIYEGSIYDIENFVTRRPTGICRPVSSPITIVLTNLTIVTPVLFEVSTIARHKFEVKELSEIHNIALSYCPDQKPVYVIGDCDSLCFKLYFLIISLTRTQC